MKREEEEEDKKAQGAQNHRFWARFGLQHDPTRPREEEVGAEGGKWRTQGLPNHPQTFKMDPKPLLLGPRRPREPKTIAFGPDLAFRGFKTITFGWSSTIPTRSDTIPTGSDTIPKTTPKRHASDTQATRMSQVATRIAQLVLLPQREASCNLRHGHFSGQATRKRHASDTHDFWTAF